MLDGAPVSSRRDIGGADTTYPQKFALLYEALRRKGLRRARRDSSARWRSRRTASPLSHRGTVEGEIAAEPRAPAASATTRSSGIRRMAARWLKPEIARPLVSHRGQAFRKLRTTCDVCSKRRAGWRDAKLRLYVLTSAIPAYPALPASYFTRCPTITRCFSMSWRMPRSARSEQPVERFASERNRLGRALDLDEPPIAGLHDVHVHLGARVIFVGQVEQRFAVHDADARRGNVIGQRNRPQDVALAQLSSASASATNAPVMDAVRVPPSAWMTSQSIQIVRSPSAGRFVTARSERPMSR